MIKFNEKYILSGYGFNETSPYLLLDSVPDNNSGRLKFNFQGQVFSLERFKRRYCIGRYNIETFESSPCPQKAILSEKSNTCIDCFLAIGFNPAFYNVPPEELSLQQRRYNEQPHNVYLAYFSSNIIKVGIAHSQRTLTRWCEQGARVATIIKRCRNAYEARDVEATISEKSDLSDAITSTIKRKLLNTYFDYQDADQEIRKIRNYIATELHIEIEQTEIHNLQNYYIQNYSLDSNIVDVSKEKPLYISGKGIGMIGDILIVEQGGRQFMVSIKLFVSHLIRITDQIKEHLAAPIQMAFL